jgi:hypothetical protein
VHTPQCNKTNLAPKPHAPGVFPTNGSTGMSRRWWTVLSNTMDWRCRWVLEWIQRSVGACGGRRAHWRSVGTPTNGNHQPNPSRKQQPQKLCFRYEYTQNTGASTRRAQIKAPRNPVWRVQANVSDFNQLMVLIHREVTIIPGAAAKTAAAAGRSGSGGPAAGAQRRGLGAGAGAHTCWPVSLACANNPLQLP